MKHLSQKTVQNLAVTLQENEDFVQALVVSKDKRLSRIGYLIKDEMVNIDTICVTPAVQDMLNIFKTYFEGKLNAAKAEKTKKVYQSFINMIDTI